MAFKWNDAKVVQFAKQTTQGPYGFYRGCKTAESKLIRYKLIERARGEFNMLLTDDPDFDYEGYEFEDWFMDVYVLV